MLENVKKNVSRVKIATSADDLRDALVLEKNDNVALQRPDVLKSLNELIDIASYLVFHFDEVDSRLIAVISEAFDYTNSGEYLSAANLISKNREEFISSGLIEEDREIIKSA